MNRPLWISVLLTMAACDARAPERTLANARPSYDSIEPTYVRAPVPVGLCIDEGADCGPDLGCCDGLFCSIELMAYGPYNCLAPMPDGAFCVEDAHCSGGHCINNTCRPSTCGDAGGVCAEGFGCCDGLVCELFGYTEGVCVPPFENGRFCMDADQCASGNCVQNQCAAADCRTEGTDCYDPATACCPGLFCDQQGGYGIALCSPPRGTGEFCLENAGCASFACVDNVCL